MIHKSALDATLVKSLDHLSHINAIMNALMEKVHRHPALAEESAKPMHRKTKTKTVDGVEKC